MVKLPKLELKKFYGNPRLWQSFWDSFSAAVDFQGTLSDIDKFNYLKGLLEGAALSTISGLSLTSENYKNAVSLLTQRFGNEQVIINSHMEALMSMNTLKSSSDVKKLRQFYDGIETQVRGLESLKVLKGEYGSMMISVLMSKLPDDLKLFIGRKMEVGKTWNLDEVLLILRNELETRERCGLQNITTSKGSTPFKGNTPTAAALLYSEQRKGSPTCTYCKGKHASKDCSVVTNISARKQIIKSEGRCFICLRKGHIASRCESTNTCFKCAGKHHVSVCEGRNERDTTTSTTAAMYVSTGKITLLQTAQVYVSSEQDNKKIPLKLIFDSGSQRSYMSARARNALKLPTLRKQTMLINSFGNSSQELKTCDVVKFNVESRLSDFKGQIDALVVETICSPIQYQNIAQVVKQYRHLSDIELADQQSDKGSVEIDLLIGSDHMWEFLTGEVKRGETGPVATKTTVGWVLSGPVEVKGTETKLSCVNFVNTHVLRTAAMETHEELSNKSLHEDFHKLWDLDSVGIRADRSVHEMFEENLTMQDGRYTVKLPFKENCELLPDNYDLSLVRLKGLVKRLRKEPDIFKEYDNIIQEQIKLGIVETVTNKDNCLPGTVHYIPHQPVLRKESVSTKMRVVYDASAKTRKSSPSLNESLYTGPPLTPLILDILLRFRSWKYGLVSDVEKAFLQIGVQKSHQDYLRFLWIDDIDKEDPEVVVLKFTRVIFGVKASPFLLNATLHHHILNYFAENDHLSKMLLESLYVDDLSAGTNSVKEGFALYKQARECLAEGKFNLRKWASNSKELMKQIKQDYDSNLVTCETEGCIAMDDESYSKLTLGNLDVAESSEHKVLGMNWNCEHDTFTLKLSSIVELARSLTATKRNLIKVYSKMFDPMGILSPMFAPLKILFQDLCASKIGWDEPIPADTERIWSCWLNDAERVKSIWIPRFYFANVEGEIKSTKLIGFGDGSKKCYAAVVYLLIETTVGRYVSLVSSKTRVAPLSATTIPRLELLAALILSRLVFTVKSALKSTLDIDAVHCFSDSKTVLFWIHGGKELKQFCQNRVNEILTLTKRENWRHCPGRDNPADIGSRGILPSELRDSKLYWTGPEWLLDTENEWPSSLCEQFESTEEGRVEEKKCQVETTSLLTPFKGKLCLNNIIPCEHFGNIHKLLRVTAYVKRFINNLKARINVSEDSVITHQYVTVKEIAEAERLWLLEIQSTLCKSIPNYSELVLQLRLFVGEDGVTRCEGRFANSDQSYVTKYPAFIPRNHHLAKLLVEDAHKRVNHGGVKDTLSELRTRFWIVRGRQYVKFVLFRCSVCKKVGGKSYSKPKTGDLPDFRTCETTAFSKIGCDMAGPLYIKEESLHEPSKAYICVFTCTVSRALHLEVVPNLSTEAFIRALSRFTSRRGIPQLIVSDNATTFKAANKILLTIFKQSGVQNYLTSKNITWKFILEKAPWWGGFYERMIGLVKRSLKKVLGNACLSYEELVTIVTDIEATLNSRPLTYIYSDENEEPLTPSHLITGKRILSLPSVTDSEEIVDEPPEEITKRMSFLNTLLKHFWQRWSREYLRNLREFHTCTEGSEKISVSVGDVVLVHEEKRPRQRWKRGVVDRLIRGADQVVRGARVKVLKKSGKPSYLNRPIQLLFPFEMAEKGLVANKEPEAEINTVKETSRPRRAAAINADKNRRVLINNLDI